MTEASLSSGDLSPGDFSSEAMADPAMLPVEKSPVSASRAGRGGLDAATRLAQATARLVMRRIAVTDLASLHDEVTALVQRATSINPFVHPDLLEPAMRYLGPGDLSLAVVEDPMAARGQRLRAVMPLARAQGRYGPLPGPLSAWRHVYSTIGTPLIDPCGTDAVWAALLDGLAALRERVLFLPYMPLETPEGMSLSRVLQLTGRHVHPFSRHERAVIDSAAAGPDYLRAHMGRFRIKEMRRLRRRLGEQGALEHQVWTDEAGCQAGLERFFALEASGWKGSRETALACLPDAAQFFRSFTSRLARRGAMRIDALTFDGAPIAMLLTTMPTDGRYVTLKIAYDETFARASPGTLLLESFTHAVMPGDRRVRVDSMATPDHPLANRLWSGRMLLADLMIGLRPGFSPALTACAALETVRLTARDLRNRLQERSPSG